MISLSNPTLRPQTIFSPLPTKRVFSSSISDHNPRKLSVYGNKSSKITGPNKVHLLKPVLNPTQTRPKSMPSLKKRKGVGGGGGQEKMWVLCGIGYWVQGFRCFPWLALNFHMANGLGLSPSSLQLVQNTGNLPMVAKPLYGVLSDALYIGGAHRLPYISFGAFLQVASWGTLALMPITGNTFPIQMACILLGNLGASFTEVVSDALVAEFSKTEKAGVLQSYATMALAMGGILGNLCGGYFLLRSQQPQLMFSTFALLLTLQLALSLTTREDTLYSTKPPTQQFSWHSVSENLSKQFSNMVTAISQEKIFKPLAWIVASIAAIPILSGNMFCYQTQVLNLDASVIGLSKVIGQIFFLSATFFYNGYLKGVSMRKLIFGVQLIYALSLLSDIMLVKQINLQLGISNEAHVLCLSALAEAAAQFKILPFTVLLSSLCPPGCEGSLFAFFASATCLASILSGVFGVALSSLIGLSSGDYLRLPLGIALQAVAALIPLAWISSLPGTEFTDATKEGQRSWKRLKGDMKWS